ncbi:MAG: hypothetical protein EP346_00300 [Bacteroidetes bacterium]|nr:MAG: hypothetical protein EP346_00300 [Bacteroidota bacterium]
MIGKKSYKRYISTILNGIFFLSILLFTLDAFTPIEIKSQPIKSFSYLGLLTLTPLTLIWNLMIIKPMRRKVLAITVPTLSLIGILMIGPLKFVFSASAWQTQTVIYQNCYNSSRKVEFQMKDVGALGYNRRTVEVKYLSDLFMITYPVDPSVDHNVEWVKVDNDVNELELKFP